MQLFSPSGQFLWQMHDIASPCQIAFDADENLWVAELGYRSGMWPGTTVASTTANRGSSPEWDGSHLPLATADGLIAAGAGGESVAYNWQ